MPSEKSYTVSFKYRVPIESNFRLFEKKTKTTDNSYETIDFIEAAEVKTRLPFIDPMYEYYISPSASDKMVRVDDPNDPDPNLNVCFDVAVKQQYRRRKIQLREMCWGPAITEGVWTPAIVDAKDAHQLSDIYYRFYVLPENFDANSGMGIPFNAWRGCVKMETQKAAVTYTVQSGDNVWDISNKFGVSWESIVRLNGLANPEEIYIGQVLTIMQGNAGERIVDHMYSQTSPDGVVFGQKYRWVTWHPEFFKTLTYNAGFEGVTKMARQFVVSYKGFREMHAVYQFDTFDGVERIREAIYLSGPDQVNYEEHEPDRDFWYFTVPEIEIGVWDFSPASDTPSEKKSTPDLPSVVRANEANWKCTKVSNRSNYTEFYLSLPFDYRFEVRVYDMIPGNVFKVNINGYLLIEGHYYKYPTYIINSINRTITPNIVDDISVLNFDTLLKNGNNSLAIESCRVELSINPIQYSLDYV